jgi:hypothetical protein
MSVHTVVSADLVPTDCLQYICIFNKLTSSPSTGARAKEQMCTETVVANLKTLSYHFDEETSENSS